MIKKLLLFIYCLLFFKNLKWKKIKKLKQKFRKIKKKPIIVVKKKRRTNYTYNFKIKKTRSKIGFKKNIFIELFDILIKKFPKIKKNYLQKKLFIYFYYLRKGSNYDAIEDTFEGISKATLSRIINTLTPLCYVAFDFIKWPDSPPISKFEGVVGSIDCTSHRRWRVHPGQRMFYRYKKNFFKFLMHKIFKKGRQRLSLSNCSNSFRIK